MDELPEKMVKLDVTLNGLKLLVKFLGNSETKNNMEFLGLTADEDYEIYQMYCELYEILKPLLKEEVLRGNQNELCTKIN